MSSVASAIYENKFSLNAYVGDDESAGIEQAASIISENKEINVRPLGEIGGICSVLREARPNDIVIVDNYFVGVDNLAAGGAGDISTSKGTIAGFKLVTDYCDRIDINPGLKIIFTQHRIEKRWQVALENRRKKGDNVHILSKNKASDISTFSKLVREFSDKSFGMFLKEKYDYVSGTLSEWALSDEEKCILLGVRSLKDPFLTAATRGTASLDAETRFDLLYRLRQNLGRAYGNKSNEKAGRWLRTPISLLDHKSPIEFLGEGYPSKLAELVWRMEGR